jgi:hypothetical protein
MVIPKAACRRAHFFRLSREETTSGNARRSASKEALDRRAVTRAQHRTVHHEPIKIDCGR